jgi:hypothetical protein
MGFGKTGGTEDPKAVPLGTPTEVRAAGFDLKRNCSCCVRKKDPGGGIVIKGCGKAGECSALFSRTDLPYGGFGPPSDEPGTAGKGREYVIYSIEYPDGSYMEQVTWCYLFLGSFAYNCLMAQGDPKYNGPKVRFLGKAGEGGKTGKGPDIYIEDLGPLDKNNNRTKNYKIVPVNESGEPLPEGMTGYVKTVGKAPRLNRTIGGLAARNLANKAADDEALRAYGGESRAATMEADDVETEDPVVADAETAIATADEQPENQHLNRRTKRRE